MLRDKLTIIKEFIHSYIETYQECLNTSNPDFIFELVKSSNALQEAYISAHTTNDKCYSNEESNDEGEGMKQLFKQMLSGLDDLDETLETSKQVKLHRNLTRCYFNFTRKIICDFVPKRIKQKMVNLILKDLDSHLIEFVFEPYLINRCFDQVLAEEESVVEDRNQAELMLNAVNKALSNMPELQFC